MFENFDFIKLFDIERIFEGSPGASFQFYTELVAIFGIIFFLGIVFSILLFLEKNKVKKKPLRKIKSIMFWTVSFGFIYLFMRTQNVYLFSSRSMLYMIFIYFVVRFGFVGYYFFAKHEEAVEKHAKLQELKKYIPKPKKKGKK